MMKYSSTTTLIVATLVLLAAFAHSASAASSGTGVEVYSIGSSDDCCGFTESQKSWLKSKSYTKVVCPFGLACVGTANFPDAYMKECASMLASLIDIDRDGVVDDKELHKALTYKNKGPIVVGGKSKQEEDPGEPMLDGQMLFKYTFSSQVWKGLDNPSDSLPSTPTSGMKLIISEEVSHMFHQYGYAVVKPAQFGVDDFSSVVCTEMSRVACAKPGWHHQENKCPGTVGPNDEGSYTYPAGFTGYRVAGAAGLNLPLQGTCSEPSCDCVEFFNQAIKTYRGIQPGWFGAEMPTSQSSAANMLSAEFKNAVNAWVALNFTSAFEDGNYGRPEASCAPKTSPSAANKTSPSAANKTSPPPPPSPPPAAIKSNATSASSQSGATLSAPGVFLAVVAVAATSALVLA